MLAIHGARLLTCVKPSETTGHFPRYGYCGERREFVARAPGRSRKPTSRKWHRRSGASVSIQLLDSALLYEYNINVTLQLLEIAMTASGEGVFTMSEEAITGALEATRTRLARAEKDREELDRSIATAREEMRLLEQLLTLRREGVGSGSSEGHAVQPVGPRTSAGREKNKHQAITAVIRELEAVGRPVHISELMRLLREKEVEIPGAGTQANLISHLRRDDRLVRPSRGMYGLAAWGLQSMVSGRRKRRRRKRMRATSADHK